MERLVFIGPGHVGLALGHALSLAPGEVSLVYYGRRPDPPAHPLFVEGRAAYRHGLEPPRSPGTAVLLTVRDALLPEVVAALAESGEPQAGCAAFHCSGAFGADVLAPLHSRGYSIGTFHPLQSIPSPLAGPDRFKDSFFAISGEPEALSLARRLAAQLGGAPITVPTSGRPLYHAAAVMVSNYLVTLLDAGARLFQRAGASPDDAEAALVALARGTLENVQKMGAERALTGPLMRGEFETVELHLRAMGPEDAAFYAALGRRTLGLVHGDLDPGVIERFEELFLRHS